MCISFFSFYPEKIRLRKCTGQLTWWLRLETAVVQMHPPKPAENRLHQLLQNHIYAKLTTTPPNQSIPPVEKRPESMLQNFG